MSTSEYRSVDAESDLPVSAAELAALATQLYAASVRPGPDSPPQTAPVAPRGNVPDTTAAASAARAAAGTSDPFPAAASADRLHRHLPARSDVSRARRSAASGARRPTRQRPGYDGGAVGRLDDRAGSPIPTCRPASPTSAPSLSPPRASSRHSRVCWPARGRAPRWPRAAHCLIRGRIREPNGYPRRRRSSTSAGLTRCPPRRRRTAPAGDGYDYHFLTGADPVPQLPDDHEVFDVNAIRADFPILKETINGKPLIWFDNAATTQKPQVVIDRLSYFYAHENSNIHRAAHELAARATDAYEEARETVRRFIGAPKAEQNIVSCVAPPKPSTWSLTRGAASTWARATRSSSPTWSTTPISFPGNCFRSRPGHSEGCAG